jgi:hypothetical protein
MAAEEAQSNEPRGVEPQSAEELPQLVVESDIDRWKRAILPKDPGTPTDCGALKDPGSPPRFGIGHIMVWTACWGIYVTIVRAFLRFQGDINTKTLVIWTISGIGTSAAFLGLSIVIVRRVRGSRWTVEPGQWLLACDALHFLCMVQLIWSLFKDGIPSMGWCATVLVLSCGPYLIPLFGKSVPRLWKCMFVLLLAVHVGPALYLMVTIFEMPMVIPFDSHVFNALMRLLTDYEGLWAGLLPSLFAAIDFRRRRQYSWLHWLGIAAGITEAVTTITFRLSSNLG